MTALSRQQHPNSIGYLAGLIILLATATALIFLAWPTAKFQTIAAIKPIPPVQYQTHSVERHGADALAIRKCLEDKKVLTRSGAASTIKPFTCGAGCQTENGDSWQSCRTR